MKIGVAGAYGAFGKKHLDALAQIDGVNVTCIMGRREQPLQALANEIGIANITTNLDDMIARADVDAIILSTPTQLHASQSIRVMQGGKHVLCEIPMSDSLADARQIVQVQHETGMVGMVGHVRRFNPSHQWINTEIKAGRFSIHQMNVQTYFFRRTNTNAVGDARSWTDHLLWHHACHTVDLFMYQTDEVPVQVFGLQGPQHPDLNIAMDMTIGLKSTSGAICTLSLSFNNDGPFGTEFRYIGDSGTYIARYDDLFDGRDKPVDLSKVAVSSNGIELIDREFIAAIREDREPNSSFKQGLAAVKVLDEIQRQFQENE